MVLGKGGSMDKNVSVAKIHRAKVKSKKRWKKGWHIRWFWYPLWSLTLWASKYFVWFSSVYIFKRKKYEYLKDLKNLF